MRKKVIAAKVLAGILAATIVFTDSSMMTLAAGIEQPIASSETEVSDELEESAEENADESEGEEETSADEEVTEEGTEESAEGKTEDETVDETENTSEEVEEVEEKVEKEEVVSDEKKADSTAELTTKYPEFEWNDTIIIGLSEDYKEVLQIAIPEECTNILKNAFYNKGYKFTKVDFSNASGLQTINDSAFKGMSLIEEIDLSGCTSLTTIDNNAFYSCSKLSTIKFPTNLHKIGSAAFYGTAVEEIVLVGNEEEGLTEIGNDAFKNCSNLKTVVDNAKTLKSVGTNVFNGCNIESVSFAKYIDNIPANLFYGAGVESVTIPKGFTEIGKSAFQLSTLSSITFEDPDARMVIGEKAFASCAYINNVTLPKNTSSIGTSAFDTCKSLTSIIVPDAVNEMGTYVFNACSSLVSATMPSGRLETVPNSTFSGCIKLESVTLPDNIITIGDSAFSACKALTEIDLPNYLTTIGTKAFYASGLKTISFPNTIVKIGTYCFATAVDLTSVEFTENSALSDIGEYSFQKCTALTSVSFPKTSNYTTIKKYMFTGCTALKSIVVPNTVTTLDIDVFELCENLIKAEIPSVTKIGDKAFYKCTLLLSLTSDNKFVFNNALSSIGTSAFEACESIKTVTIPEGTTSIGGRAFYDTSTSTIILQSKQLKMTGDSAFGGNKVTIKEVVFPEDITAIPEKMFYKASFENGCKLVVPGSVTTIGNYAFCGDTSVTNLPSLEFENEDNITSIGDYAFANSTKLTELSIPKNVTSLGKYAFQNCQFIDITIPSGVKSLPDGIFSGCNQLSTISFSGIDITSIGKNAFDGCTSLAKILLPQGTSTIDSSAFKNCTALAYIYLPSTITKIDNTAFSGCTLDLLRLYVLPETYAYNWAVANNLEANISTEGVYTIEYVLGEGASNSKKNPITYVPEFETVVFCDPTRANYDFDGWYLEEDYQTKVETTEDFTGDVVVYAKWVSAPKSTITFSLSSGTNVSGFQTKYIDWRDSDELAMPTWEDIKRNDYVLVGWQSNVVNSEGVKPIYRPGEKVTDIGHGGAVTLSATWVTLKYSASSYATFNDGFVTDISNSVNWSDSITLISEDTVTAKTGYVLTGRVKNSVSGEFYNFGDTVRIADILAGNKSVTLTVETAKAEYFDLCLEKNAADAEYAGTHEIKTVRSLEYKLPAGDTIVTRKGYSFLGWYTSPTKPATAEFVTSIPANKYKKGDKVTLYAIWQVNSYDIDYHLTEDAVNNIKNPAKYVYGKRTTLLAPTREGYTFAGWFTNPECTGTKISFFDGKATETFNVYPKWTMNKYSLMYNINGGNVRAVTLPAKVINLNDGNVKSEILITDVIEVGNTTIRPGYTFEGWSTDKTATIPSAKPGEKYSMLASRNNLVITLFATWKPISYKVEFDLQDSDSSVKADNSLNVAKLHTPATVIKLANPTREGFTFAGWYLDKECTGRKQVSITRTQYTDITLYAKWTPNKYYLTFNANGGVHSTDRTVRTTTTAALARSQKDFYQNVTLPGTDVAAAYSTAMADRVISSEEAVVIENANKTDSFYLTKKNFVLVGWNTAKDGSGIHYDLGTSISSGTEVNAVKQNAAVILYAEWAPVASAYYTIKYEVNGGTINNSSAKKDGTVYTQVKTSSLAARLVVPVRTGYTFGGWYTDSAFTSRKVVSFVKGTVADQTVYAKWTENAYRIVYNVNGGKKANAKALAPAIGIKYTTDYPLAGSDQITRDTSKYEFLGWSTVKDAYLVGAPIYAPGETVQGLADGNNKAVVLYAQWKQIY